MANKTGFARSSHIFSQPNILKVYYEFSTRLWIIQSSRLKKSTKTSWTIAHNSSKTIKIAISYTVGTSTLPDICRPQAQGQVCIYQAKHSCPWYKYYILYITIVQNNLNCFTVI